jgi:RimJ/RimL family protein N-acetyltransferase
VPRDRVSASLDRWSARGAAGRALGVLRHEGLRALWFKMLGETVYRRLVVVERPLALPVPDVAAQVLVEVALLRPSEIAEYRAFRPEASEAEIASRLRAGQICFVARSRGRIVSTRWVAVDRVRVDYLSMDLPLAPDEACSYDMMTSPDFRGQSMAPVTSAAMLRHFQRAGFRRFVGTVLPTNEASFRAIAKTGYRRCGWIGYVGVGRWRWEFHIDHGRRDAREAPSRPRT